MSGDKTWVKVLSEDLQRDAAARAHMREYAKKTLSAIKQVSRLPWVHTHMDKVRNCRACALTSGVKSWVSCRSVLLYACGVLALPSLAMHRVMQCSRKMASQSEARNCLCAGSLELKTKKDDAQKTLIMSPVSQVYVMGISMPDLAAAIGGPLLHENLKAEGCRAMEAALLKMIQQPSVAEPVHIATAAPRPAGPPHAGTCPLPDVSTDAQ